MGAMTTAGLGLVVSLCFSMPCLGLSLVVPVTAGTLGGGVTFLWGMSSPDLPGALPEGA